MIRTHRVEAEQRAPPAPAGPGCASGHRRAAARGWGRPRPTTGASARPEASNRPTLRRPPRNAIPPPRHDPLDLDRIARALGGRGRPPGSWASRAKIKATSSAPIDRRGRRRTSPHEVELQPGPGTCTPSRKAGTAISKAGRITGEASIFLNASVQGGQGPGPRRGPGRPGRRRREAPPGPPPGPRSIRPPVGIQASAPRVFAPRPSAICEELDEEHREQRSTTHERPDGRGGHRTGPRCRRRRTSAEKITRSTAP